MNLVDKFCEKYGFDKRLVMKFAITAPHRYKVYSIPKRNRTGHRIIAHPSRELKFFQRTIHELLYDVLPTHSCAMAYKRGASIKENALRHADSVYLLKMDFANFFPSITPEIFFHEARRANILFGDDDRRLLTLILFRRPAFSNSFSLSIGAPSSPLISNFVMAAFDTRMDEICKSLSVTYTRYADDITFSTKNRNVLQTLPRITTHLLGDLYGEAIQINHDKTIYSSKKHNRHVTGLTLTNDGHISIGRDKKRQISAMIHRELHSSLDAPELCKLSGLLGYVKFVEPRFFESMARKYGLEQILQLQRRASLLRKQSN